MSDKDKLILLTNQVEELKKQNKDFKELITQYDEQNNAAEKKINALNQIHQDKVRNLMNSISVLKKENAQLKNQSKEHKRSQLIEQLNQEIADQDLVITTLRSIVNDEKRCDNQIIEALNKGPPKVKALTREELKIECKRLENALKSLKEQYAKKQEQEQQNSLDQSTNSNMQGSTIEEKFQIRITNLIEENSNQKARIAALEERNVILERQLDEKSREITVLNEQKGNLVILSKKYEQLQKQLEDYKKKQNLQEFNDITKELDIEEQKMLNKVQETKLESVEKQLRTELDIVKLEKQAVQRDLDNVTTEKGKLVKRTQQLEKRLGDQEKELNAKSKELRERIEEFAAKETDYKQQIEQLESIIQNKIGEIGKQSLEIQTLKENISKLDQQIEQYQAKLQRAGTFKQADDLAYDIKINKQIQGKLRQQSTSDDPKVLKQALQQQQEYYEQVIRVLQQRISAQQQQANNLSDVSSNISKLVKQEEDNQQFDMMSSDVSQFQKASQYEVDSNIEEQNIPSDIHSSVTSILNAPKPSKKQVDYSYSKVESFKSSDLDKISSNLSDQQNQSLSKVSSNLSKISFTSSMHRAAAKRY